MLLKNYFEYPIIKNIYDEDVCPRTENQLKLCEAIDANQIIFVSGPAGTGKSMLSIAKALQLYQDERKTIHKIILTRPVVGSGEELGFLPGTMEDKIHPYLLPLYDYLKMFVQNKTGRKARKQSRKTGERLKKDDELPGYVEIAPLAYLRGRTFNNSIMVIDEAQNINKQQFLLLLTRIGHNCKMIITGDEKQSDLHRNVTQGFSDAINRLVVNKKISGIVEVRMTKDDILRNGIIREIIDAYEE